MAGNRLLRSRVGAYFSFNSTRKGANCSVLSVYRVGEWESFLAIPLTCNLGRVPKAGMGRCDSACRAEGT